MYKVTDEIDRILKAVGFTTVTFGDIDEVDLDKHSLFPLAHVSITGITRGVNVDDIAFEMGVFDLVMADKQLDRDDMSNPQKLVGNEIDIANDLNIKLNTFVQQMKNSAAFYKMIEGGGEDPFFYAAFKNKLAGFIHEFNVKIERTKVCV